MSALLFIGMAVVVLFLIHLYLWWRLIRDTTDRPRWRRIGGMTAIAAGGLSVTTLLVGQVAPPWYEAWLSWPGYLWLAVMFYLLIALLALELPLLAAVRFLPRKDAPGRPPATAGACSPGQTGVNRRSVLRRGAAVTAGLAAVGVTGFGITRAYRPPTIKRLSVPLARLDPRADGLRVAVISDIHAGPMFGRRLVERVVDLVNGLDADVVAIVGDMISRADDNVRESVRPLARLRGRAGAYFVTGNHEYHGDYQDWTEVAQEVGLRRLQNERVEIAHGGGAIDLAGVNDLAGHWFADPPDYAAALGDRDQSRPVLLLAHQPVAVYDAARYQVDLQLSGHTHGGQAFPFHWLVALQQPVVSGLAEVDGTPVYVTNGAGFWGPPVRVGADPDISLIELRAGS